MDEAIETGLRTSPVSWLGGGALRNRGQAASCLPALAVVLLETSPRSKDRGYRSVHSQWRLANSALQSRGGDGGNAREKNANAAPYFPCTKSAIVVEGQSPLLVKKAPRQHRRGTETPVQIRVTAAQAES
jgi:hypothetical protein